MDVFDKAYLEIVQEDNDEAAIYLSKKSYLKKCKKAAPKYVHFFVF